MCTWLVGEILHHLEPGRCRISSISIEQKQFLFRAIPVKNKQVSFWLGYVKKGWGVDDSPLIQGLRLCISELNRTYCNFWGHQLGCGQVFFFATLCIGCYKVERAMLVDYQSVGIAVVARFGQLIFNESLWSSKTCHMSFPNWIGQVVKLFNSQHDLHFRSPGLAKLVADRWTI